MMLLKLVSETRSDIRHSVVSLGAMGSIGLRIRSFGIPVTALGMSRGIPTVAGALRLFRVGRAFQPDLVQGWMYHGNLASLLLTKLLPGSPVNVWNIRQTLYSMVHEKWLSRWVIRANAAVSRMPAKVIYNSDVSRVQHESFGFDARKSVLIPNGFDLDVFRVDAGARQSVRHELDLPQDAVIIGMIARYHPMKDHKNFISAANILLQSYPEAHFALVGKDVDRSNKDFARMVGDSPVSRRIHLLGERSDVPRLAASFDISTSSSSEVEAFSNAIGEAMCCGVPCVVTNVGTTPEVVGDTGVVVPPKNPEALANGWAQLLALSPDERRRLGLRARERIKNRYGLAVIAAEYRSLYESLVA